MKFCSKCSTTLITSLVKRSLICPRCDNEEPLEFNVIHSNNNPVKERIVVVGQNERNLRTTPQVNIECPKCGNNLTYWWMVQTRNSDESATQFFRCTRCGHTQREYS